MKQAAILLMALTMVFAIAITVTGGATRSRFLLRVEPKKCNMDPTVCYSTGSTTSCCGEQCVDLETDAFNCGKCGKVCKLTDSCCNGKCTDLSFNKKNCGQCGNTCQKGVLCYYGMCNYA